MNWKDCWKKSWKEAKEMNVSDCDVFVVRSGKQFLIGTESTPDGRKKIPLWGQYKYDAWRTKNIFAARRIARILGGNVCMFNPVTGEII